MKPSFTIHDLPKSERPRERNGFPITNFGNDNKAEQALQLQKTVIRKIATPRGLAMTGKLDESSNYNQQSKLCNYILAMTGERLLHLTLFYFNDIVFN